MLSHGAMAWLQAGQCEPGKTMDSSRGMRQMQTLRKLPMQSPARKMKSGEDPIGFRGKGVHGLRAFKAFSRAARMTATGALRPVQRWKARAPWCRSMPRPLAVRAPAALAVASRGVTAGL